MPISQRTIEEIRSRIDIVELIGSYIPLRRAGSSYKALCPFHREKTPSFHVNPARQIFHCFGCHVGGDIFKFVMLQENLSFLEAVRLLAQKAGVALDWSEEDRRSTARKETLYRIHDVAARFYQEVLLRDSAASAARQYLKKRRLGPEAVERFGIGYASGEPNQMEKLAARHGFLLEEMESAGLIARAEDGRRYDRFRERLMFPIRDPSGRVIAFSGRILEQDDRPAKYLNSPETPLFRKGRTLFALDLARKEILERGVCLLCEGQIDVIRCHLSGFPHAVAALGTAVTEDHAAVIKRHADHVILVMDADEAGRRSAIRTAQILLSANLTVEIAQLPAGEDPDSLLVNRGAEAFQQVLDRATSVVGFLIDSSMEEPDLSDESRLQRATQTALDVIRAAPSEIQRRQMVRELSQRVNIPEHVLREEMQRLSRGSKSSSGEAPATPGDQGFAPPPPEERHLLWLMAHHPEWIPFVLSYVSADHLSDPRTRTLFPLLVRCNAAELVDAARAAGAGTYELATEILADTRNFLTKETAEQGAQDLVLRIRRRDLERRILNFNRLRDKAPTEEERDRLTREIAHLRYELVSLRGDWEKVRLALELSES